MTCSFGSGTFLLWQRRFYKNRIAWPHFPVLSYLVWRAVSFKIICLIIKAFIIERPSMHCIITVSREPSRCSAKLVPCDIDYLLLKSPIRFCATEIDPMFPRIRCFPGSDVSQDPMFPRIDSIDLRIDVSP